MKLGIISDTHLGDDTSKLKGGRNSRAYKALRSSILDFTGGAPLKYLVLNGDILDFSINGFHYSMKKAKPFFKALKTDGLAEELVYIPGNHDKYVWDAVEWERNIIRKLNNNEDPKKFKGAQPVIINLKAGGEINLVGVKKDPVKNRYGTLFIEGLFEKGKEIPVYIAYPNLYIKTKEHTYVVSHGHMLDAAWVLVSELLREEPEIKGSLSLENLEKFNVPLTSMICTGIGQGGEVSEIIYEIQKEVKQKRYKRIMSVLVNMIPRINEMTGLPRIFNSKNDFLVKLLKKALPDILKQVDVARHDKKFFEREHVQKRLQTLFSASSQRTRGLRLGTPTAMIFGHTHEPIPYDDPYPEFCPAELGGKKAPIYNTGGWCDFQGKSAEVFFMNDDGALSSVNIS